MKALHCLLVIISLFFSMPIIAVTQPNSTLEIEDRLTVHNRTPRDLYVAIYFLDARNPFASNPTAERVGDIKFIEADTLGIIDRPVRRIFYDRELVFVDDKDLLKQDLSKRELDAFHSENVGSLKGSSFYIGDKAGEFYGYNTVAWNLNEPILKQARTLIMNQVPQIIDNPYKATVARVRVGNEIPAAETEFLAQRMPNVRVALEKLLGRSLQGKYVPKIAVVSSGGGYRAMVYTNGFLRGAKKAEILDAITYMVGLSGSTWAIAGWVLSGKSIEEYHEWLVRNIRFGLKNLTTDDLRLMGDHLLAKYFYDEPYDIVDIYGSLLANELFADKGNRKQRQTLSSQADRVRGGSLPLPIYTAIAAENLAAESLWYEFTPYEVGGAWLGMYVPSWSFGRKFKDGASVSFAPEQNFGVLMATFGLAVGVTIDRIIKEIDLKNKAPLTIVKNIIDRIVLEHGEKRVTSSDFCNFTLGMNSPLKTIDMKLADAGINFNLPYPPISGQRPGRKADIIIFVDASGNDDLSGDLRKTEEYARRHNLKFPTIDYSMVGKKAFNIFKNEQDPNVPVVVYIPRILEQPLFEKLKDQPLFNEVKPYLTGFDMEKCLKSGPCGTLNFEYQEKDARALSGLGTFNILAAKQSIIDAINWVIDRKSLQATQVPARG